MNRSRTVFLSGIACSLALVALWVSEQSFWIDECNAAVKAIQPDIGAFWKKFSGMKGSDFQIPFYMFLLWCWEKIVGRGEFALRALNILFAWSAILLVATRRILSRRFRLFWCFIVAVSPMLAAYMDEARPYALQFMAATLVWFGMAPRGKAGCPDDIEVPLFAAGIVLLCGSSLSGVVFAFWPCLWVFFVLLRQRRLISFLRNHAVSLVLSVAALVPLALFYLHTLFAGARASAMGGPDVKTLAFCLYEFAGFMGVGPSRLSLRADSADALRAFALPVSFFGLVLALFLLHSFVIARRKNGTVFPLPVAMIACSFLGVLSMTAVGAATGMRILARHWMPALPALFFFFAWVADVSWNRPLRFRIPVFFLLVAYVASSLSFRFSSRHAKDDYRSAMEVARAHLANGNEVWWAADGAAPVYYGIGKSVKIRFHTLIDETDSGLEALPFPGLVVFSKPDVYDRRGSLVRFLRRNAFSRAERLTAIDLYVVDRNDYSSCAQP